MIKLSTIRRHALKPVARWTPGRKAALCAALRAGAINVQEAVDAHGLTVEEVAHWLARSAAHGIEGLRVYPRRAA